MGTILMHEPVSGLIIIGLSILFTIYAISITDFEEDVNEKNKDI